MHVPALPSLSRWTATIPFLAYVGIKLLLFPLQYIFAQTFNVTPGAEVPRAADVDSDADVNESSAQYAKTRTSRLQRVTNFIGPETRTLEKCIIVVWCNQYVRYLVAWMLKASSRAGTLNQHERELRRHRHRHGFLAGGDATFGLQDSSDVLLDFCRGSRVGKCLESGSTSLRSSRRVDGPATELLDSLFYFCGKTCATIFEIRVVLLPGLAHMWCRVFRRFRDTYPYRLLRTADEGLTTFEREHEATCFLGSRSCDLCLDPGLSETIYQMAMQSEGDPINVIMGLHVQDALSTWRRNSDNASADVECRHARNRRCHLYLSRPPSFNNLGAKYACREAIGLAQLSTGAGKVQTPEEGWHSLRGALQSAGILQTRRAHCKNGFHLWALHDKDTRRHLSATNRANHHHAQALVGLSAAQMSNHLRDAWRNVHPEMRAAYSKRAVLQNAKARRPWQPVGQSDGGQRAVAGHDCAGADDDEDGDGPSGSLGRSSSSLGDVGTLAERCPPLGGVRDAAFGWPLACGDTQGFLTHLEWDRIARCSKTALVRRWHDMSRMPQETPACNQWQPRTRTCSEIGLCRKSPHFQTVMDAQSCFLRAAANPVCGKTAFCVLYTVGASVRVASLAPFIICMVNLRPYFGVVLPLEPVVEEPRVNISETVSLPQFMKLKYNNQQRFDFTLLIDVFSSIFERRDMPLTKIEAAEVSYRNADTDIIQILGIACSTPLWSSERQDQSTARTECNIVTRLDDMLDWLDRPAKLVERKRSCRVRRGMLCDSDGSDGGDDTRGVLPVENLMLDMATTSNSSSDAEPSEQSKPRPLRRHTPQTPREAPAKTQRQQQDDVELDPTAAPGTPTPPAPPLPEPDGHAREHHGGTDKDRVHAALGGQLPRDARIFWDGKLQRYYAKWTNGAKWVHGSNAPIGRFGGDHEVAIRHVAAVIAAARSDTK